MGVFVRGDSDDGDLIGGVHVKCVQSSIGMVEWPRMVRSDLQGLHDLHAVREEVANHALFCLIYCA